MADAILAGSGVYAIVNTVNGKRYVGSAIRLRYRFAEHVRLLNKSKHHSVTLQRKSQQACKISSLKPCTPTKHLRVLFLRQDENEQPF